MNILDTIQAFRFERSNVPRNATLGFIPTMGGLHDGHLSLITQAKKECDFIAVSIFVNPKQFSPNEDFSSYPRPYELDIQKLKNVGVDFVFAPSSDEIYKPSQKSFADIEGFGEIREAQARPGFFRGVATILVKLFNIVSPTHAYFGQKDAAQCVAVRRIIEDLNFNIRLRISDTYRESDGLAMSTRNQYLSDQERASAGIVFKGLSNAKNHFSFHVSRCEGQIISAQILKDVVRHVYEKEPLVTEIEYISVASKETMEEIDSVEFLKGGIISVAVKLGKCRLIDNIVL